MGTKEEEQVTPRRGASNSAATTRCVVADGVAWEQGGGTALDAECWILSGLKTAKPWN